MIIKKSVIVSFRLMWSKIPQSDQIKCLTLLCIVPTCDFFQHTFQQIFLLALLHLFGSDRVFVGEDGVTELNLLPQSQRRESSFQGDLFKKMIKIDVSLAVIPRFTTLCRHGSNWLMFQLTTHLFTLHTYNVKYV